MTGADSIGQISGLLRLLLQGRLRMEQGFGALNVDLRSPRELRVAAAGKPAASLWLYRISRFGDRINDPPRQIGAGRLRPPPIPLRLDYLLTPMSGDALTDQRMLGVLLQTMADSALLGQEHLPAEILDAGATSLSIHPGPEGVEDLARIWHAMHEPYALSAAYAVHYVPVAQTIDIREGAPVRVKTTAYAATAPRGGGP